MFIELSTPVEKMPLIILKKVIIRSSLLFIGRFTDEKDQKYA